MEPLPLTAILALGLLLAFDLVTPEQAVAGFSNTGVLSAFISNTATVSILMPVSLGVARQVKIPSARWPPSTP